MRILLISTNKLRAPRPALPMGMALIAASLKVHGHEVHSLDLLWESRDHAAVIERLRAVRPEVVGVSVRNLDNLAFLEPVFFAPQIRRIVQCCRKYSWAPVVLGGSGFSVAPEAMLEFTGADYGIVGEGEDSAARLLETLETGGPASPDIPGLCRIINGRFILNPPECSVNLNKADLPDRSLYDRRYFQDCLATSTDPDRALRPAFETLQTKRGCGLDCAYCIIRKTEGDHHRFKDPGLIIEEIRCILAGNPNIEELELVDATFNYPPEHGQEICESLIRSEIRIPWFCQINPRFVDEEFIRLLERAGCRRVELGTDSFSDPVLENLHKGFDFQKVVEVDRLFSASTIEHTHCVFFGGPGESGTSHLKSLQLATSLLKPAQVFASLGIRTFPDTPLYELAIARGVISTGRDLFLPTFYVEPEILAETRLLDSLQDTVLEHPNWYLWWGLKRHSLSDRVAEAEKILYAIEEDYIDKKGRAVVP